MLLATGSIGGLGKKIIDALRKRIPVQQIAALALDPEKATEFSEVGITVKKWIIPTMKAGQPFLPVWAIRHRMG